MRGASLFLPLLLAGCVSLGHCGPTPTEVEWHEPEFASILAEAEPEGWTVHAEPRPHGLAVDHPWLRAWNGTVRSIGLSTHLEPDAGAGHGHGDMGMEVSIYLIVPTRVSVHVLADRDPQVARPVALRFLEALTDGNESQRGEWADELLAEADLPEGVDYPAPEYRHFSLVPYELDLPPERLRLRPFVDEHLSDAGAPTGNLRSGDWRFDVVFAKVLAVQGGQEFHASPARNQFESPWTEDDSEQDALADFHAAYASLGLGAPPEDARVGSVIC